MNSITFNFIQTKIQKTNHKKIFMYFYFMKSLTIQFPSDVDIDEKEAATVLAAQLYEMGKLSLGQAAEVAGYSKRTFMELLGKYGVSVFNYSADEIENDLKNAERYHL